MQVILANEVNFYRFPSSICSTESPIFTILCSSDIFALCSLSISKVLYFLIYLGGVKIEVTLESVFIPPTFIFSYSYVSAKENFVSTCITLTLILGSLTFPSNSPVSGSCISFPSSFNTKKVIPNLAPFFEPMLIAIVLLSIISTTFPFIMNSPLKHLLDQHVYRSR